MELRCSLFGLAVLATVARSSLIPKPLRMPFNNTRGYGPDGPWHFINLAVGSSSQLVDFYPTFGSTESILQSVEACISNDAGVPCISSQPGAHDTQNSVESTTADQRDDWVPVRELKGFGQGGAVKYTGGGRFRTATIEDNDDAKNVSFFVASNVTANTVAGSYVPLSFLSLDANRQTQTDGSKIGSNQDGTTYLSAYTDSHTGASSSFALHLGSPSLQQNASLYFGGYDQSRLIEEPAVFDIGNDKILDSITFGTAAGSGPSATGRISEHNSQAENLLSAPLKVELDPSTPYMTLPMSICERMASVLPIAYNSSLGLYTWQSRVSYSQKIASSASFLNFTFADDASTSIRVPLALLTLTLTKPLVEEPVPYFPCAPSIDERASVSTLGRAFLQAAFLAANYDQQKLYLGQAPGPDQEEERVITLASNDSFHPADDAVSWEASWASVFRPLVQNKLARSNSNDDANTSASYASNTSNTSNTSTRNLLKRTLSNGAIAGIVMGILGALTLFVALITVGYLLHRRCRQRRHPTKPLISINPSQLDLSHHLEELKPTHRGRPPSNLGIYADGMSGYHEIDMSEKLIKNHSRSNSRSYSHSPSPSVSKLGGVTASRSIGKNPSMTELDVVELDDTSPATSRSTSRQRSIRVGRGVSPDPPPVPPKHDGGAGSGPKKSRVLSLLLKTAANGAGPLSPRGLGAGRGGGGSGGNGRMVGKGVVNIVVEHPDEDEEEEKPAVPEKGARMPVEIMDRRFSKPVDRLPGMAAGGRE